MTNKVDPVGFARLISKIAAMRGEELYSGSVKDFHDLVLESVISPPASQQLLNPTIGELNKLMEAFSTGRFVEAIKAHRALTGWGLKESKEAVEVFMVNRGAAAN